MATAGPSLLQSGDAFPEGVTFSYIPFTAEKQEVTACGVPQPFDVSTCAKDNKIVLVAVPGAFTPTCQVSHLASYTAAHAKLRAAGVDRVIVIASNDPWVMSAWGKANKISDDFIAFMSDADLDFSQKYGWRQPSGKNGHRTGRFAMVIDHGKVIYNATDQVSGSVENSGADAILAHL